LEIGLGLSEVKCYPTVGITVSFIVKVTVTVQVSDNDRIWGRVWSEVWCDVVWKSFILHRIILHCYPTFIESWV